MNVIDEKNRLLRDYWEWRDRFLASGMTIDELAQMKNDPMIDDREWQDIKKFISEKREEMAEEEKQMNKTWRKYNRFLKANNLVHNA